MKTDKLKKDQVLFHAILCVFVKICKYGNRLFPSSQKLKLLALTSREPGTVQITEQTIWTFQEIANRESITLRQSLLCQKSLKYFRGLPAGKKRKTHGQQKEWDWTTEKRRTSARYVSWILYCYSILEREGEVKRGIGCKNIKEFELTMWGLTTINPVGAAG